MQFFSGFCLKNEQSLFKDILDFSDFSVAGFSFGAKKAFYFAKEQKTRVDRLFLISPLFFQDTDEAFKRMQLLYFKKDPKKYKENFFKNIAYPCKKDLSLFESKCSQKELKELLYFKWDEKELEELVKKGIDLQIHIGFDDKIINTKNVYHFFKRFGTVYLYKNKGHILCKQ